MQASKINGLFVAANCGKFFNLSENSCRTAPKAGSAIGVQNIFRLHRNSAIQAAI
jgi:hypothetical protein